MVSPADHLWQVTTARVHIDPAEVWQALTRIGDDDAPLDYRTRHLIHEALLVLRELHPSDAGIFDARLRGIDPRHRLDAILHDRFDDFGYPYLRGAMNEPLRKETIEQFLREVDGLLHASAAIVVGGASSLILRGVLSRSTHDVDVVDEVPSDLRQQHDAMARLAERYRVSLTHFQSHYLPRGWERRTELFAQYRRLSVRLVDLVDVVVGKLYSKREKDRDDLRALLRQISKQHVIDRLPDAQAAFGSDVSLVENAKRNWHVLFGEDLPIQAPPIDAP